jgi:hypothetical protein
MSGIPARLVKLGRALDVRIELGDKRMKLAWTTPHWLCCDVRNRTLFIIPQPQTDGRRPVARSTRAAASYRQFHDFEPSADVRTKVRTRAPKFRGRAVTIGYRSNKWTGKAVSYEHEFEGRPRVTQIGDVYRIAGAGLRVTSRGVEG